MDNEKTFLKNYDSQQYEKMSVTADIIITDETESMVLLIRRKNYPFKGINLLKLKQKQREWQDSNPQHPRPLAKRAR